MCPKRKKYPQVGRMTTLRPVAWDVFKYFGFAFKSLYNPAHNPLRRRRSARGKSPQGRVFQFTRRELLVFTLPLQMFPVFYHRHVYLCFFHSGIALHNCETARKKSGGEKNPKSVGFPRVKTCNTFNPN